MSGEGIGTAFDDGDGDRNTINESLWRRRTEVNACERPVSAKLVRTDTRKGSPPKEALSVRDTSPPKSTAGVGEEGVCSP